MRGGAPKKPAKAGGGAPSLPQPALQYVDNGLTVEIHHETRYGPGEWDRVRYSVRVHKTMRCTEEEDGAESDAALIDATMELLVQSVERTDAEIRDSFPDYFEEEPT